MKKYIIVFILFFLILEEYTGQGQPPPPPPNPGGGGPPCWPYPACIPINDGLWLLAIAGLGFVFFINKSVRIDLSKDKSAEN